MVVAVLWDVAEAVQILHERDIVHSDLKPGNVLFDRDGHLLLTDFGLASLRKRSDSASFAVGTPAYMAPEMFEGNVSPQSDVYALGIMLFELLAGRLPFTGDLEAIRKAHCESPLPVDLLPDATPAPVIEVIERAAHKNEVFRYKRGELFQRALQDAADMDELRRTATTKLKDLILGTRKKTPRENAADTAKEPSTTTYFDRISELAAEKRTPGSGHLEEGARPSTDEAQVERPSVVSGDLLCICCGYNLRGLSVVGRCSECGTPVQRSRRGNLLAVSDSAWMASITRGEKLIYAAFQLALFNLALSLATTATTSYAPSFYRYSSNLVVPSVSLLAALLLAWGIFKLTALDPRLALTEQPRVLRRFIRWAATASIAVLVIAKAALPYLQALGTASGLPRTADRVLNGILSLSVVCGFLCALIGSFYYLAILAVRIPNPALAARTKSRAKGFAILAGLTVSTLFVGVMATNVSVLPVLLAMVFMLVMVGYVMSLARVLSTYRKEFTRCLQQARESSEETNADIRPTDMEV